MGTYEIIAPAKVNEPLTLEILKYHYNAMKKTKQNPCSAVRTLEREGNSGYLMEKRDREVSPCSITRAYFSVSPYSTGLQTVQVPFSPYSCDLQTVKVPFSPYSCDLHTVKAPFSPYSCDLHTVKAPFGFFSKTFQWCKRIKQTVN